MRGRVSEEVVLVVVVVRGRTARELLRYSHISRCEYDGNLFLVSASVSHQSVWCLLMWKGAFYDL